MSSYRFGAVKTEVAALADEIIERVGVKADELIAAREDVMAAIASLRVLADELEQRAIDAWPTEGFDWQVQVEGVGVFVKGTTGDKTTWDHRGAGLAVTRAALTEGRIHHPADVVDVILDCASLSYWRLGAMAALHVDGKQHREKIPGRPCIHRT